MNLCTRLTRFEPPQSNKSIRFDSFRVCPIFLSTPSWTTCASPWSWLPSPLWMFVQIPSRTTVIWLLVQFLLIKFYHSPFFLKKNDFEWIYFIKLFLLKRKFNVKWYKFGYIHVKLRWEINLRQKKNIYRWKNIKFQFQVRMNLRREINFIVTHQNMLKQGSMYVQVIGGIAPTFIFFS